MLYGQYVAFLTFYKLTIEILPMMITRQVLLYLTIFLTLRRLTELKVRAYGVRGNRMSTIFNEEFKELRSVRRMIVK